MAIQTWVNHLPGNQIPLSDRGLAYGDGLFETMRVQNRQVTLKKLHWNRLQQSCKRLSFQVNWQDLEDQFQNILKTSEHSQGTLKLILTRGSGERGYFPSSTENRALWQWFSESQTPSLAITQGIELFPCKTRLAHQPRLAGIKHLNRLEQVLARQEWTDARYAEGLMQDMIGQYIEGTMSNLFIVHQQQLMTPDLSQCGVSGIMREWILHHSKLNLPIVVSTLTDKELLNASEIFICNSLHGIWPVTRFLNWTKPVGPCTIFLQQQLIELGYGIPLI